MVEMFKANVEAGHWLSRTGFITHQERKIDAGQQAIFHRAIGALSVTWGKVEILLDYSNQFFIVTFEIGETQLPVSLKPKLAFFKKHFDRVPRLLTCH